jgi:hypothetical protein
MVFDEEALNDFYEKISAPEGMNIDTFKNTLASLFESDRITHEIENYRLGRSPWKKLRDEISPVSSFLSFNEVQADRIRFPLDNHTPDCWLINDKGSNLGIEVTIERGREKYHLATELNRENIGRGFIGAQDDEPQSAFDRRMSSSRVMYAPEQALEATKQGILRCLEKKNQPKYEQVFYLLIQAHLNTLPHNRWDVIKYELIEAAKELPFREIYVIGDLGHEAWGFKIK